MKRFLSFVVLLVFVFSIPVYAFEGSLSLGLDTASTELNNKRFEVDLYANSTKPVSAMIVQLTYDNTLCEFVKAYSDVAEIQTSDNGSTVKAVLLSDKGTKHNKDVKLASFVMKGVNSGSFEMKINCTQAVNSECEYMKVGETYDVGLTLNNTTLSSKNGFSKRKSKTSYKRKSAVSEVTESDSTADEKSLDIRRKNIINPILFGLGAVCFMAVVFGAGMLYKKSSLKDKNGDDKKSEDNNSEDNNSEDKISEDNEEEKT